MFFAGKKFIYVWKELVIIRAKSSQFAQIAKRILQSWWELVLLYFFSDSNNKVLFNLFKVPMEVFFNLSYQELFVLVAVAARKWSVAHWNVDEMTLERKDQFQQKLQKQD